jgi:hypothetical protein
MLGLSATPNSRILYLSLAVMLDPKAFGKTRLQDPKNLNLTSIPA